MTDQAGPVPRKRAMFVRDTVSNEGQSRRVNPFASPHVRSILTLKARPRLVFVATTLAFLGLVVGAFVELGMTPTLGHQVAPGDRLGPGLLVVVGFGVALLARSGRIGDRALAGLGLGYQIFVCGTIAVMATRASLMLFGKVPVVTWTEVLLVAFPMLIPATLRVATIGAVAAAATRPLAALLVPALWGLPAPVNGIWAATVSPVLASIFAIVAAHAIYTLGQDVARGRELGSYQLTRLLGRGDMGEVWAASHHFLARRAAVKFIRSDQANADEAITRFEREAQITAELVSPHTVHLYDFGLADDGTFYYVMEFLHGVDLQSLVETFGPLDPERAIDVTAQVCASLAEAHDNGLVHRDVKPANVLLCQYGRDYDFAKVLNFGLAAAVAGRAEGDGFKSAAHAVIGTAAFMSPEAALGHPIDHRSDVYATGCLVFWMLTGQPVFREHTEIATIVAHASKEPPDVEAISEFELPPGLGALVRSCLAKDPADRPQNASDLAEALRAMTLPRPWTPARAKRWWERHDPLAPRDAAPPTADQNEVSA